MVAPTEPLRHFVTLPLQAREAKTCGQGTLCPYDLSVCSRWSHPPLLSGEAVKVASYRLLFAETLTARLAFSVLRLAFSV